MGQRLALGDEAVDGEAERGPGGRAGEGEARRFRWRVILREIEHLGLGIGEQSLAVHGDGVARPQEAEIAGIGRRARHLGQGYGLEGLGDRRHRSARPLRVRAGARRSEEHTSELQSLMRISYAVFCLKKKKQYTTRNTRT